MWSLKFIQCFIRHLSKVAKDEAVPESVVILFSLFMRCHGFYKCWRINSPYIEPVCSMVEPVCSRQVPILVVTSVFPPSTGLLGSPISSWFITNHSSLLTSTSGSAASLLVKVNAVVCSVCSPTSSLLMFHLSCTKWTVYQCYDWDAGTDSGRNPQK